MGDTLADIFLSYQKRDIDLARRMVAALTREGFSVWWDDRLDSFESWDRTIEREIAAADAVLVLWTPNSVQSDWVRIEANYAKTCTPSKLVQARFSGCEVPMAFSMNQYVDLNWDRPASTPQWARLLEWIRIALGQPVIVESPQSPRPTPSPARPARTPATTQADIAPYRITKDRQGWAILGSVLALKIAIQIAVQAGFAVSNGPFAGWDWIGPPLFQWQLVFTAPLLGYLVYRRQLPWQIALCLMGTIGISTPVADLMTKPLNDLVPSGLATGPAFGAISALIAFSGFLSFGKAARTSKTLAIIVGGIAGFVLTGLLMALAWNQRFYSGLNLPAYLAVSIFVGFIRQLLLGAALLQALGSRQTLQSPPPPVNADTARTPG